MTSPNTCPVCGGLLFGGVCRSCHQQSCPYRLACRDYARPGDSSCAECRMGKRVALVSPAPQRSPICPKCGVDERTVTVAPSCECEVTP